MNHRPGCGVRTNMLRNVVLGPTRRAVSSPNSCASFVSSLCSPSPRPPDPRHGQLLTVARRDIRLTQRARSSVEKSRKSLGASVEPRRGPTRISPNKPATLWGYSAGASANSGARSRSSGTHRSNITRVNRMSAGSPPHHSYSVGGCAGSGSGSRNYTYQCIPLQNGLFCEWPQRHEA
jgi:hypothetical protein